MNLRESLDADDDGMEDPVHGREDFLWASAYIAGFGEGTGRRMVASTSGSSMRLHNLSNDTRGARIMRRGLRTTRDVLTAVRAQIDAIEYWENETDSWGPDPWGDGADPDLRRESL